MLNYYSKSPPVTFVRKSCLLLVVLISFAIAATDAWAQTTPEVETTPMLVSGGDPADDVAVWIHPTDGSKSVIFGTNKDHDGAGGLYAFDVSGNRIDGAGSWGAGNWFDQDAWINEVDLRYNFNAGGESWDIIAAANRFDDTIDFFRVDTDGSGDFSGLTAVGAISTGFMGGDQPYGTTFLHATDLGKHFVVASSKNGQVAQWELGYSGGQITGSKVWQAQIGGGGRPEIEGIVADDEKQVVYISAETDAIYRYSTVNGVIQNEGRVTVDTTGGNIRTDIEGLTIYYAGTEGKGYLIASDQSRNQFVVYDREWNGTNPNDYIMTFSVGPNVPDGIDTTSQTDGIEVVNVNLGGDFAQGMFIVHDAVGNTPSNYKFVPWPDVADETTPNLLVDTSWDPRNAAATPPPPPPKVVLDMRVNKDTNTWELYVTITGDCAGLASFTIDLVGIENATNLAPKGLDMDLGAMGAMRGFTFGGDDLTGPGELFASQNRITYGIDGLIFGVGQSEGTFDFFPGSGINVPWGFPLLLAYGDGDGIPWFGDSINILVLDSESSDAFGDPAEIVLIPEPTTIFLLCAAGIPLVLKRRRKK